MSTPAGWYPVAEGQLRYWDGARWTEHTAPAQPVARAPQQDPGPAIAITADPVGRNVPAHRKSGLATWLGWGSFLLVAALGAATGGVSGLAVLAGLFVLIVGFVAVIRGHVTWARLRSRAAGATALGASMVLMIVGGALADPVALPEAAPSPPPSSTPTSASPTPTSSPPPSPAAKPSPAVAKNSALAAAAALTVKGRAPKTGYTRELFGQAWFDITRSGCDTRNEILIRDLSDRTMKNECKVLEGTLAPDPYTGTEIRFVIGGASEVDIDHVVAIGDGYQKGAAAWTDGKRVAFANDPLNLLAVSASANRAKGDGDAATWLPPNKAYRCTYVARQIAVKRKYGLWVTAAERDAMMRVLTACPATVLPAAGSSPTTVVLPTTKATPTPTPTKVAPLPVKPQPKPAPKPKPKPSTAPKPKPKPKPKPALGVVRPGSFCAPEGARGVTVKGTPMVCSTKAGADRARWRKG